MANAHHVCRLALLVWFGCVEAAWSLESPETTCRRNRLIERWLAEQAPRWHRQLASINGFEAPGHVEVCVAKYGNPHADYESHRIWLRHLNYEEDRLSLAHEYLHLAFKRSPKALDEAFIESTARRVLLGEP